MQCRVEHADGQSKRVLVHLNVLIVTDYLIGKIAILISLRVRLLALLFVSLYKTYAGYFAVPYSFFLML